MVYDHAQSPRLGQPTPVESTGIRVFNGSTLPEVAYPGQMIYRSDIKVIQVYNNLAGAWENVVGGIAGQLTFVATEPPTAININDLWYDSDDGHRLYQWDGSAWVAVLLGSGSIAPGSIGGEHLDADAITGVTFTGNTFRTAAQGARWELGPQGLLIYDDSENMRQAATMGGDISAGALHVDGSADFNDNVGVYDTVTLNDGVTPPTNKPLLTAGWRSVNSTGGTLSKSHWVGLADNGSGQWLTAHKGYGYDSQTQPKIITINKTTGAVTENTLNWAVSGTTTSRIAVGCTKVGTNYYLLTLEHPTFGFSYTYYLHKFNNAFTEAAAFNVNAALSNNALIQNYTLGTDGTSAIVAATDSNNNVQVKRLNVTTGAVSSSSVLSLGKSQTMTAYWSGSADFGAPRQVLCTADTIKTRIWDTATSAVRHTEAEWTLSAANQIGLWWDGTRFWSLDTNGKITQHSTVLADETETWSYAWSDGGTGRSLPSNPGAVFRLARQYVHVKVPTPPVGLQACIYAAVNFGVRTLQSTYLSGTTESDEGTTIVANPTIENTTNTLTVSFTPASMVANANGFSVNGKSDGSIGTGTFRDSVDARITDYFRAGTYTTGTFSGSTDKTVVITFGTPFPVGSTVRAWIENAANGNTNPINHTIQATTRTSMTVKINRPTSTGAATFTWYATRVNSTATYTES